MNHSMGQRTRCTSTTRSASGLRPARWFTAALLLSLGACGGGGSDSGGNPAPANVAPIASAGTDRTVAAASTVTLDSAGSRDPDGSITAYAWSQTAGPAVVLSSSTVANPTFTTPTLTAAATLTFSLVVTDNAGAVSPASTVSITVTPPTGNVTISGLVRFERVPFLPASPFHLNFAAPVLQPARGIVVRLLDANSGASLGVTTTTVTGAYSFVVAANTSVKVQAEARMLRDATQALPRWNVRVQDGTASTATPYSYSSAAFNSSTAGSRNIDIPTGIGANGVATGPRASGPFAILDTLYTAMQAVIAVSPTIDFPELYVDWASDNDGTFFTAENGDHIAMRADLTEDTDEFDQHVVAHEFGHFLEARFSRFDSIGGSHALGDRLDMRVAYSEGYAYAFAAIVLNDPVVRDSFTINGQQSVSRFNLEDNPPASGTFNAGCWCSEASVWSILWDLYDDVADGSDTVSFGFAPIWQTLTGAQRTTPALTSIFSFMAAFKAAQPASAAALDALLAAQNIEGNGIDAFASSQISVPFTGLLPLYATAVQGVPLVLRTTDDGGVHNKAGNRRFVRYTPPGTGTVSTRIVVSSSNANAQADPDFIVFRSGTIAGVATAPPPQPEDKTFALTGGQTYVLDVYDCANGCADAQGVRGDYDLTVTIN